MTKAKTDLFKQAFSLMQSNINQNAVDKGFWDASCNVGEKIALVHSELSEALEFYRKAGLVLSDDKLPHRSGFEVELADAIIRIMDLAAHMKLDLAGAILEKHAFNKTRPRLHGKKF